MWTVWQCQIIQLGFWCTPFVYLLTSLHVRWSLRPFLTIFEYCKIWSQGRPGNQAVHFVCSVHFPACCQDYAICHFRRLLQSVPIPGNLLLLMEYLDTASAELEEGRVECAGWLCTLACKSARVVVLLPGRKRVIQELHKIHVLPGIARMKALARNCVWWASLDT